MEIICIKLILVYTKEALIQWKFYSVINLFYAAILTLANVRL